jgi:PRTRC genetic system protein B
MHPLKQNDMKTITQTFGELFHPVSALLIYRCSELQRDNIYVEAYDIGKQGNPVNAHPLSLNEAASLAASLNAAQDINRSYLKPKGLLPPHVLYLYPDGFVMWHTPPMKTGLRFTQDLSLEDGDYPVPRLLWKADKTSLHIFAVKEDAAISLHSPLCHAPFFNIYEDGRVCMGTVNVEAGNAGSLEDFISAWQGYFFNSTFSHLIRDNSPVKTNIITQYKSLARSRRKFPQSILIENGMTVQNLIP